MNSILPIVTSAKPVFLVGTRAPRTWYAFHDVSRLSRVTSTALAVFMDKRAATAWALSLEAYHDEHGHYPSREVRRGQKLPWVRVPEPGARLDPPARLDVVCMPFADVAAMVKGTGINCRMMLDPANMYHKMDVLYPPDRAATCARLEHEYSRQGSSRG